MNTVKTRKIHSDALCSIPGFSELPKCAVCSTTTVKYFYCQKTKYLLIFGGKRMIQAWEISERIKGLSKSEKISPMNYCVPVYWNTVVCFVYDSWNRQWLGLVEKVMSGQRPLWHVTTCSLKAKAAQRSLGDHLPEAQPQRSDFTRQKGRVRKATPFLLFWYEMAECSAWLKTSRRSCCQAKSAHRVGGGTRENSPLQKCAVAQGQKLTEKGLV